MRLQGCCMSIFVLLMQRITGLVRKGADACLDKMFQGGLPTFPVVKVVLVIDNFDGLAAGDNKVRCIA